MRRVIKQVTAFALGASFLSSGSALSQPPLPSLDVLPPPMAAEEIPIPEGAATLQEQQMATAEAYEQRALQMAREPSSRVYAEYDGILYPLLGIADDGRNYLTTDIASRVIEGDVADRSLVLADRMRADSRFLEANGKVFARTEFLLPPPIDSNDVFFSQLNPREARLSHAWDPQPLGLLSVTSLPEKDLLTRFRAIPSLAVAFDTGFTGNKAFNVPTLALGPHPAAGQTTFSVDDDLSFNEVPFALLFDNQIMSADLPGMPDQQMQLYVEATNHFDREQLNVEHIYTRVWNKERASLGAGKTYSLFSTHGIEPASIDQTVHLIGTGHLLQRKRAQIRVQRLSPAQGGWGWGVAVEDPYDGDFVVPNDATKLNRWPSFTANMVYVGANKVDRIQLSSLVRTLGFEAATGEEHFDTAWGVSCYGRFLMFANDPCQAGGLYVGAAAGEGVGQYINGIGSSAVFDGNTLNALEAVGAFVGYKHRWIGPLAEWESNLAYGYAELDAPSFMPNDTNERLQHAWANILYHPNPRVALGFEYQYGVRETVAAGNGEDNRFMLVVALTSHTTPEAPQQLVSTSRSSGVLAPSTLSQEDRMLTVGPGTEAYQQGL